MLCALTSEIRVWTLQGDAGFWEICDGATSLQATTSCRMSSVSLIRSAKGTKSNQRMWCMHGTMRDIHSMFKGSGGSLSHLGRGEFKKAWDCWHHHQDVAWFQCTFVNRVCVCVRLLLLSFRQLLFPAPCRIEQQTQDGSSNHDVCGKKD